MPSRRLHDRRSSAQKLQLRRIQNAHTNALAAPAYFSQGEATPRLLTQTEFVDDGLIAFGIVFFEVVEQAATLADQHEKAAA